MKRKPANLFWLSAALWLMQSCATYKNIPYFRDVPDTARTSVAMARYTNLQIEPGDILSVNIETIDPEANMIFNQAPTSAIASMSGGAGTGGMSSNFQAAPSMASPNTAGYLVDDNGVIEIPLLGKIHVGGLTTFAASDTVENRVALLYKKPTAAVRFANLKVSVLGEVLKPGTYTLTNEKNTILDALSMAGDLSIFGKRTNALLIRDSAGQKNFIRFSLNNKDLVKQDYFYLKQNDVIYIEPGKGKAASQDAQSIRYFALITSVLTLIIVLVTRVNY